MNDYQSLMSLERLPSLYNHIHESTETQATDPRPRPTNIQSPVSGSANQQRRLSVSHTLTHTLRQGPERLSLSLSALCQSG